MTPAMDLTDGDQLARVMILGYISISIIVTIGVTIWWIWWSDPGFPETEDDIGVLILGCFGWPFFVFYFTVIVPVFALRDMRIKRQEKS